jgi:hypothetical protein
MTAKAANDWSYLRRKALEEAEALGTWSNSGRLPTSIRRIAEKQLVKGIQFTPLIVEGAISVEPDGFLISIRSDKEESGDLEKRLRSDPTGRKLSHRVRFTLAHEIAHTFFFDLKTQPPKNKINLETPRTLHTLETACHRVAGALLLPRRIFEKEFATKSLHRPDTLSEIARQAYISKSALVSRLSSLNASMLPRAILASVSRKEDALIIEALWRHYSFREMFPELQQGMPFHLATRRSSRIKGLQIYGGSFLTATLDIPVGTSTFQEWVISVESRADSVTTQSFFIALFRACDFDQ